MPGRLFPPRRAPAEGEVDLRSPISAFGRYDLLEKIGEGQAKETFVARSDGFEGLFRLVALQRLKPALCSDVAIVSRFIEEARLAVRVEHPGTVGVEDFGRVGGVYFIACELVDGVTLEELMARVRARGLALDPRAAAFIARAVAHAVDAVHNTRGADGRLLGLVHGDLRPKNVLVGREGRVKVRGFAAPSLFADLPSLAGALEVAGIARQPPEVLAGAPPSARGDVWRLGVLLHELLTGARLFAGTSLDEVVAAVRAAPIEPPSARRPGIPSALEAVVDEALVRVPERRPGDARAFAQGLDDYLRGAGYDVAAFRASLDDLDQEDARGAALAALAREPTRVKRAPPAPSVAGGESLDVTAPLPAPGLCEQLHKDPGPWGLVRLAERTADDGRVDEARAMSRAAAIVFASRGLLAHALCAYEGARASLSFDDVTLDLRRLAEIAAGDLALRQQERGQELRRVGGLAYFEALRAQTEGLDKDGAVATPFLSALPPDAFARLGALCRVRRVRPQSHVLREGEPGDSLFAVGEGRLVVTCTPSQVDGDPATIADVSTWALTEETDPGIGGRVPAVVVAPGLEDELRALESSQEASPESSPEASVLDVVDPRERRVFLSALTAGDLFGEFSFLTGRPRSASVEAVTSCRLVEITRRAVGDLLDDHPALREALEAFYKERVLEWMLAKNEVFSLLAPESRRALLARCGVHDIPAGRIVVREGELHDAMYFIKRGEVEVSLDDDGVAVFINKLGAGEFFGEIAALEGGPRRASVRAVTDLEVFRITRRDLQHVLKDAPEVRVRLEQAMRARSAELRRRIAEQRRVLAST